MAISISSQYTRKSYFWTAFKAAATSKGLNIQYDDDGTVYTIYGYDGPDIHVCTIWQGVVPQALTDNATYTQAQNDSDKSDFTTSYQPTANKRQYPKNTDGLRSGGLEGNLALTTGGTVYEAKVGGSALDSRKVMTVQPVDADIYYGFTSGVTTSSGTLIKKGATATFVFDPYDAAKVYLVCATSSKNARITESP